MHIVPKPLSDFETIIADLRPCKHTRTSDNSADCSARVQRLDRTVRSLPYNLADVMRILNNIFFAYAKTYLYLTKRIQPTVASRFYAFIIR